jgi:hypothetical protein
MKPIPFKFKVRTLLLGVVAIAVLIEVVGLGRRSRRFAAQAEAAAATEETNLRVSRNSKIAAAPSIEEADLVMGTDPARQSPAVSC